ALGLKQLDGLGYGGFWRDGDEFALAAGVDQVADGVARRIALKETVLAQPIVIEEFAEVIAAGVAADDDDHIIFSEAAGVLQRGSDVGTGGAAQEQPFLPGHGTGGVERFGVGDANPFIDDLAVERLGDKIFADAFDAPTLGRTAGENTAVRVGP